MNLLRSAVVLLLGVALPAAALAATRGESSSPASAPSLNVPYERFVLDNGLTVLVYTDHSVPNVFVGVRYRTGSKDEPEGRSGFAHLFEHLMFQQTVNRKGDYMAILDRAGAVNLNGNTTADFTNYYQTVPTNALDLALWMESDRMGYLDGGITQDVLDEQRGVVQNEKRQHELQPGGGAYRQFLSGYYPAGHPYAHPTIGSMEDLDAATLDDVKQWFNSHYGPANAVLVLAGDIDPAAAREKVARYFGGLEPGNVSSQAVQWVPSFSTVRRDVAYERVGGTTVSRTWPVTNEDARGNTLLQLAALTMTGVRNAPLARDLSAVARGVNASFETSQLGSTFQISMQLLPGIDPQDAGKALDAAIENFIKTGPSREGIASIIVGTDTAIIRSLDSNAEVANFLLDGEVERNDPLFFLRQRDWINQARPEGLRDQVSKWLRKPFYEQIVMPPPGAAPEAQDVDRTRMPEPGPLKTEIMFPEVSETTLSNGMKLVMAQRHKLPLVDVTIRFDTGAHADADYAPGAATAAFGMLSSGSEKYDQAQIAERSSLLDVPLVGAAGTRRSSTFSWNAAVSRLDESFAFAAEVLRHPRYSEELVRRAASSTREALSGEQDPLGRAGRLFEHAIWGDGDPRGRLARSEDYDALTRDSVVRFHENEIGPSNATLFLIGDIEPSAAKAMAEKHFGSWKPNQPAPVPALPPANVQGARIILVDAPGAGQSAITVGNVVPAFDATLSAAEALANSALANGSHGRLNMDLRERRGWTYGFGGGVEDAPAGERVFSAGGNIQTDRTAEAVAVIQQHIAEFVSARPITQQELDDSKDASVRSVPLSVNGNGALLGSMVGSAEYGLPFDRVKGAADRLSSVTLEQARAAALRMYRPEAMTWLVVGDLAEIEQEVRALGIAPVEVWDASGRRLR